MLLLTGARRTEVAEMRWSEVDMAARVWTIPAARSKNKVAHTIPLSDQAIEILEGLKRVESKGDFVFTFGRVAVQGFARKKIEIDAAITADNGAPIAGWTYHDLRRTLATNLQKLGVRLEVTEAVLGHTSGSRAGIVGVYQRHDWAQEKHAALEAWSLVLDAVVTGASAEKLRQIREGALQFAAGLKGSTDERRAQIEAWLKRIDAIVTGEPPANVVELAKARG